MKNLGVAIVDMQDTYLKSVREKDRETIILAHRELFGFAKKSDLPIFVFYMGFGEPITPSLSKELSRLKTYAFYKTCLDGFQDTFAGIVMQSFEISRLIISGMYRSDCVCETARGARERGIEVYSSLDLTADHPILTSPLLASNPQSLLEKNAEVFSSFEDLVKKLSCHHSN